MQYTYRVHHQTVSPYVPWSTWYRQHTAQHTPVHVHHHWCNTVTTCAALQQQQRPKQHTSRKQPPPLPAPLQTQLDLVKRATYAATHAPQDLCAIDQECAACIGDLPFYNGQLKLGLQLTELSDCLLALKQSKIKLSHYPNLKSIPAHLTIDNVPYAQQRLLLVHIIEQWALQQPPAPVMKKLWVAWMRVIEQLSTTATKDNTVDSATLDKAFILSCRAIGVFAHMQDPVDRTELDILCQHIAPCCTTTLFHWPPSSLPWQSCNTFHPALTLWHACTQRIINMKLEPRQLYNALHSLAILARAGLLDKAQVARQLQWKSLRSHIDLSVLDEQDLVTLLWSLGTLGLSQNVIGVSRKDWSKAVRAALPSMASEGLGMLVDGLALLNITPPQLGVPVDDLCAALEKHMKRFNGKNIAKILLMLGGLHIIDKQWMTLDRATCMLRYVRSHSAHSHARCTHACCCCR